MNRMHIRAARTAFGVLLCLFLLNACAAKHDSGGMVSTQSLDEAWSVYNQGNCARSGALFQALASQEEHPSALNGLGMSLMACGEPEGAAEAFRRASAVAPGVAELRVNYGNALFSMGKYSEAERQFDAALKIAPGQATASLGKAAAMLKTNRTQEAMTLLGRLQKQMPDSPELKFNQAIAMYQNGLYPDAAAIFADYLRMRPDDAEAWNALGVVELAEKQTQKAKSSFDRAIGLVSNRGAYYFNRGNAQRDLQKLKDAQDDYTRAAMYTPDMAGIYLNRGEVRYLLGDKIQACRDLKQACDMGYCERLESYRKAGHCKDGAF